MPKLFWNAVQPYGATDKSAWIVESMASRRNKYSRAVKIVDSTALWGWSPSWRSPLWVHGAEYVEAVRREDAVGEVGEGSCGLLALASASSLTSAVMYVTSQHLGTSGQIVGSLGVGMHHARASESSRGHVFNGLAIAAAASSRMDDLSSSRQPIVILDLDGSCGGGTAALIAGQQNVCQVDIAVNDIDAYQSTANATLQIITNATGYLDSLRQSLDRLEPLASSSGLCVYSAGVDAFEGAERGLRGMTSELLEQRDRLVFEWCLKVGVPTAYAIGGGAVGENLSRETLVALHRQTIETAVAVMRENSRGK